MALVERHVMDVIYPYLNLVTRERLDPALALPLYEWLQYGVFFLGLLTLSVVLKVKRPFTVSAFVLLATCFVLGRDIFYFRYQWYPFFLAAVLSLRLDKNRWMLVPGLLFGVLWVLSAGAYGPSGVLVVFAFVWLLGARMLRSGGQWAEVREQRALTLFYAMLIVLLPLSIVMIPVYAMPDYPSAARLTPITPLTFRQAPLFGLPSTPNSILYSAYTELLFARGLRFFLVLLPIVVLLARQWRVAASLLLLLSLYLPGAYSPFELFRMLCPGVALVPLAWLSAPLFFVPMSLLCLRQEAVFWLLPYTLGLIALFAWVWPLADLGVDHRSRTNHGWEELVMHSPSRFVAQTFGEVAFTPRRSFRQVALDGAELRTSIGKENRAALADGNLKTRWSTARPQQGGDWIEIEFPRPQLLSRIVLHTGAASSDFPRGLRVEVVEASGRTSTPLDLPDWHGPLRWTPQGYPYFGSQTNVRLDLPKQLAVKKLRVELVKGHPTFDWSVFELMVYQFE